MVPPEPIPGPDPGQRSVESLRQWRGHALVVGCGGIGRALLGELSARAPWLTLWATNRSGRWPEHGGTIPPERVLALELGDDDSLAGLALALKPMAGSLRLVFNTAGLLHGAKLQPEKRLQQVSRLALERSFAVNAFGPLLLAQALEPLLARAEPVMFASLSARVGSIADNRLGGWYAYRGAKAAQNQMLRCLALEWRRRLPLACLTLLHPGTTATPLSAPFQASVSPERLFSPARSARQLLDVLEAQNPEQSGRFLAWDGSVIPW
ncbi:MULTISPECIES: SDR family NAD(P)-dependent oxidoreductase [unclassified Synechococcus]|uniref:SDR family NAD(P)-dependent oxidoreductase n=1 Tax=unclassified Synechococcus TaxID=2626047 RepID=UPI0021A63A0E|nr:MULTISPECIES: SDR family NAD(P)-dependent oxidoreductase [unclassified Synechococcus]MCT0214419.1 SDR family NAD(P)-dependent oxidoreductase [Synechococcus sp. CS-1326]MCT0233278.1 SDR family NAD(P)-dependent oxidoreductase [Synechococcus sp. CS-1327]